jgi:uncharacterized protein YcgI (DUF1989 family)
MDPTNKSICIHSFDARDAATCSKIRSAAFIIDYNEKIYLTTGDILYSNLSNPMLAIIEDPVAKHDFLFAACSAADIEVFTVRERN